MDTGSKSYLKVFGFQGALLQAKKLLLLLFISSFCLPQISHSLSIDPEFEGVAAFNFIPLGWSDLNSDATPDIGEFDRIYGLGFDFNCCGEFQDGQIISILDLDLSLLIVGPYFLSLSLPDTFDINDSNQFIGDVSSIVDNRAAVPVPAAGWLLGSAILTLAAARRSKR